MPGKACTTENLLLVSVPTPETSICRTNRNRVNTEKQLHNTKILAALLCEGDHYQPLNYPASRRMKKKVRIQYAFKHILFCKSGLLFSMTDAILGQLVYPSVKGCAIME